MQKLLFNSQKLATLSRSTTQRFLATQTDTKPSKPSKRRILFLYK